MHRGVLALVVVLLAATAAGHAAAGGGAVQAVSLSPDREEVFVGRRVTLSGTVAGSPGVPVAVDADPWPFEDRWKPARKTTTAADGSFSVSARPRRNTRYRARAAGQTSPEAIVYADLVTRQARSSWAGRTFRSHWWIKLPRGARLPTRRAHFYVVRAGRNVARHRGSARLRRVRPRVLKAVETLPWLSGPKVETDVLACYRERKPDAWSRVYGIDPKCGQPRLRFSDGIRD